MGTSAHHACHLLETPLMSLSSSPALDGESPQTAPEVSPLSSEWSKTFPSSPTALVMTFTELSDPEFCIDTTGGKGTCSGDSGGPLNMKSEVTKAGQQWKQVGIVSFGASAGCEVGYPAGFTRVEYYLDWIMSETGMQL